MASSDVNLIKMADSAIARSNGDVFELDVHIVLGFDQLSTVDLSRGDFEGNNMVLKVKGKPLLAGEKQGWKRKHFLPGLR